MPTSWIVVLVIFFLGLGACEMPLFEWRYSRFVLGGRHGITHTFVLGVGIRIGVDSTLCIDKTTQLRVSTDGLLLQVLVHSSSKIQAA
jgi:hypothetical protein